MDFSTLEFMEAIADRRKIPVEKVIDVLEELNQKGVLITRNFRRYAVEAQFEDGTWGQEERFPKLVWYGRFADALNAKKKFEREGEYQAFRISCQELGELRPMTAAELEEARAK